MSTASRTDEADFRSALRAKNAASLSIGSVLAVSLLSIFWVLDWFVIPQHVLVTGLLRLALVLFGGAIFVTYRIDRRRIAANVDWLSLVFELLIAGSISVMCWLHRGYESEYYAGLNLTIITAGFLFSWPLRHSLVAHGLVYALYMAPLALGAIPVDDLGIFLNNQFFLIGTVVIIVASQNHRYRLEARQFQDELALRHAKVSLEAAYGKLKQMDRLKSEFFANVTHELRTPLTMILAPLEGLIEEDVGGLTPQQKDFLRPIWKNALKLLKLINDLLDLAKLDESHLRLRVERTDLTGLLGEIVEHTRPLATRKKIDVSLETRAAADDLFIDLEKMERAIVNLVSNGLKFTEPGGELHVVLDATEEEVRLSVSDTGIGIPADQLEHVFERFRQVDGTSTRRHGGTGIGLSLAREIVKLHGGRITVESELGRGSTFVVHLRRGDSHLSKDVLDRRGTRGPTAERRRSEDREPREWTRAILERRDFRFLGIEDVTERRIVSRPSGAPRSTKLLVVEDNIDVLRFISQQLQDVHEVILARNGAEGLDLARRMLPDLVVTDYMMPEMDGLSLLRALRSESRTRDVPIVMLTAKQRVEDQLEASESGADAYLTKPFSPRVLRATVDRLLERRQEQASIVAQEQVRSLEVIGRGLAHEIRNPLSYLHNALHVIGEQVHVITRAACEPGPLEEARGDAVARAQTKIEKMLDICRRGTSRLEQLAELVRRVTRDGYQRTPVATPLDTVVEDVGRLVLPAGETPPSTYLDLGAGGACVLCVPEDLYQVVRNLWQNALEAVGPDGHVAVRTRRDGESVVLEVIDDGHGIAREDLGRVFTPFYTTKDPGRGMGLGLAISQQVVAGLGGSISVKSEPRVRTCFRVDLPTCPAESEGTTPG